jgi:hypothetical protein
MGDARIKRGYVIVCILYVGSSNGKWSYLFDRDRMMCLGAGAGINAFRVVDTPLSAMDEKENKLLEGEPRQQEN